MKTFKLTDKVRNFYGEADHTIEEGIREHKGIIEKRRDLSTNFKTKYYYVEGFIAMHIDGRQAKKYENEFNKTIGA